MEKTEDSTRTCPQGCKATLSFCHQVTFEPLLSHTPRCHLDKMKRVGEKNLRSSIYLETKLPPKILFEPKESIIYKQS